MSVPVYRRVTGSANQINVTAVYRHTVCNCERASVFKASGTKRCVYEQGHKTYAEPISAVKTRF